MTRHSFFILCLFLGLLPASAAVPETARGKLIDRESRQPVAGAVIQALDSAGKAIAYASSRSDGSFTVKLSEAMDSVSFRCMGYEFLKLPREYDFAIAIELSPKATVLKDIIVRAPDIYTKGDTLVFNVDRFADAKDNAIIDVIKRLPGIKVEEDGTIKYQGKPINKFYIDGNDFIGGQYGLATENISHEDVKSVEVMENHQPVKALEGIEFPEEAGINLKLKDDARSKWVGVAKGGAGLRPALYDGSFYTMRIAPKIQNIITLRAGNTGWNPASQIMEHDFNDMFSPDYSATLWPEYISADIVAPPLTEKRTRDNLSGIANVITAWKRGDNSMRLKLNYVADRLDYRSGLATSYFSQSIPDFLQREYLRTMARELSSQFNSEINKKGYFLKDKLTICARRDNSDASITGSATLDQNVSRREISVTNDLKLVKRNDRKLFELESRNSFLHSPNRLSVKGDDYVSQYLGITDFRSTTETQYGHLTRFWKFYLSGGLDIDYHRVNAALTGMGDYDNSGVHDAFLSAIYVRPAISYERNNRRFTANLGAKWLHHSLHGSRDYIDLAPEVSLHSKLSAKSELSATMAYRLSSPPAYQYLTVPVMADYRNLFIGTADGRYSHSVSAGMSYRYRNPLNAFFFNASAGYDYRRSPLMSAQLFVDGIIVSSFASRLSESSTLYISGGISKGLGHSKMVAGCDVRGTASSASSMRDNSVTSYQQATVSVKPYFRGSITRWLSMSYEAGYGFSQMKVDGVSDACHSFTHSLQATAAPADPLQFTLGAEHFLTRFPEGNTDNILLFDASAVWRVNNKIRLSLTANNLLNTTSYEYLTYGNLSTTRHSFTIRPRNILATLQYRF